MSSPSFKQELVGVFGQPVAENPTQPMIEAAFHAANLAWRYLTIEVSPEGLSDAVNGMRSMGFRGINLTIPHKVAVIEHLDRTTESAGLMGAVNCIVREGNELVGENTDGKGFVESLKEIADPQGLNVTIFGAGGAARAIGVEMGLAGAAQITIVNRSKERGETLVELLIGKANVKSDFVLWDSDYDIPQGTDVVINATSIGLFPDVDARLNLNAETLKENMIVADVIPNPPETRLIKEARDKGCKTLDGLGMLVNQGIIGFKLWTGIDPDPRVMRKALEDIFAG